MLNEVMLEFNFYVLVAGLLIGLLLAIFILVWMKKLTYRLALIKTALINIPYENL